MDEGSGEDLTLPRREFVMLKNCLGVLLASVTVEPVSYTHLTLPTSDGV